MISQIRPAHRVDGIAQVNDLSVVFRSGRRPWKRKHHTALSHVGFTLRRGESLAVLGRNGAGKSPLLRVLAHIIRPDMGTYRNGIGTPVLLSLQLGFVPHLTGRENAIMQAMLQGFRRAEVMRQLESIKAFSELGEAFEDPIVTYSSGMRGRLGFATAFHFDPDLLLIDEAFSVGDREFRDKTVKAMSEKIRSRLTVVLVTHNLNLARRLCDRALWLDGGQLVMQGAIGEVADAYEEATDPQSGRTSGDHAAVSV